MRKTTVNSTQSCAKKEMRYQVCPLAQVTAGIMVPLNIHLTKTMKTPPFPGRGGSTPGLPDAPSARETGKSRFLGSTFPEFKKAAKQTFKRDASGRTKPVRRLCAARGPWVCHPAGPAGAGDRGCLSRPRKSGLRPQRADASRAGTCFLPKPRAARGAGALLGESPGSPASSRARWCPATPLAAGLNFPFCENKTLRRRTWPPGASSPSSARPLVAAGRSAAFNLEP